MKKGIALALGTALHVTAALAALGDDTPCFVPPPTDGVGRVIIDARNGRITGQRRFARTQVAEIVIVNKNPFRYTYTVDVEEEAVPEAGLTAFLELITLPGMTEEPEAPDTGAAAADANKCPNIAALEPTHRRLSSDRDAVASAIEAAASILKAEAAAYEEDRRRLEAPSADCKTLVTVAEAAQTRIAASIAKVDIAALTKRVDELQAAAKAQMQMIQTYRSSNPNCPVESTGALMDRAELLSEGVPAAMRENIGKLQKTRDALAGALARIRTVLGQGSTAFTHFISAGDYDEATTVTATLTRKDALIADAEDEPVATTRLRFGGPAWFSLAGGVAGSTIDRLTYQRIQGLPVNADGSPAGTELTTVIGEGEASSSRVTPLLMLHGRLMDSAARWPVSVQMSVGLSAKADNVGTDVEYLVGPSIGLLDNKLFITVGAYGGRVQSLQGNLHVGAEVPAELAEIPVRKDLVWQLGFGVTYKIK